MKGLFERLIDITRIYTAYKTGRLYCNYPPSRLWIEPTSYCNLNCIMCLNKDMEKASFGYMDFGLYKKIIDEISGKVYDLYLHHRGESLLHPRLFDMVSYAKNSGIYTRLHTNATLLDDEKADRILDSGLDFLSFSFDGYDKETYEGIRRGSRFEKTVTNIVNFLEKKQKRGTRYPITLFTVIEFPDKTVSGSIKREFLKQFRSLPLDSIRVRRPHNWGGGYNPEDNLNPRKNRFCPCTFLWYSLSIFWDGTVVPCPQDFFGELNLGNVNDTPLLELWNSDKMVYLRKMMKENSYNKLKPCCSCDRLWRSYFLGIPMEGLTAFLKDNLGRYKRGE